MPKVGDKVRLINSRGWELLSKRLSYEVVRVNESGGTFHIWATGHHEICVDIRFGKDFELEEGLR